MGTAPPRNRPADRPTTPRQLPAETVKERLLRLLYIPLCVGAVGERHMRVGAVRGIVGVHGGGGQLGNGVDQRVL